MGNLTSFANSLQRGHRPIKNASVNKHIQRLRRFLGYCINMEWLTVNHANKIKRLKEGKPLRHGFTPEEIHMVWKNIDPRFKSYYQLRNETGLHACDMWDLTKDNFPVTKHSMELHVQQNKKGGLDESSDYKESCCYCK